MSSFNSQDHALKLHLQQAQSGLRRSIVEIRKCGTSFSNRKSLSLRNHPIYILYLLFPIKGLSSLTLYKLGRALGHTLDKSPVHCRADVHTNIFTPRDSLCHHFYTFFLCGTECCNLLQH